MFAESPVYLNPAAAGFFDGKARLFTNFRTQWASVSDNPYKTTTVGADWRMLEDEGFLGVGVNFLNDVAGDGRYKINEISVPVNYAIKLDKNKHLSVGLQPGWYQRGLQEGNITWDNHGRERILTRVSTTTKLYWPITGRSIALIFPQGRITMPFYPGRTGFRWAYR